MIVLFFKCFPLIWNSLKFPFHLRGDTGKRSQTGKTFYCFIDLFKACFSKKQLLTAFIFVPWINDPIVI